MPINEKYKVAFVHIPKNGGTTIEYLLGMHGEIDTIGLKPYMNQVRNEFLFGAGTQEFTAEQIKNEIGSARFLSYTSFCVVRNPYSRLVSYIAWAKQYRPHATNDRLSIEAFTSELEGMFASYKKNKFNDLYLKPQHHYVCDKKHNIIVNRLFKFEYYNEVLSFVKEVTGQNIDKDERRMPSNHHDYEHYLTPDAISMINEMYELDFEIFSYPKLERDYA